MDNFGRDMERMMWLMMAGAFLAGAGAVAGLIWIVQRFVR